MLRAAMLAVTTRVAALLDADGGPPAAALRRLALLLVPLDEAAAVDGRVWLAFVSRAAVDPELAEQHQRTWAALEERIAALLAAAGSTADAALLLATLDGLAVAALVEPKRLPPTRLRALVDAAVDAALRG
jgi:hypothetical protein